VVTRTKEMFESVNHRDEGVNGQRECEDPEEIFDAVDPLLHRRNLDAPQPSGSRDPAPPLLRPAQSRLSFGSGLLTLFTRRGAVKTHLTRNRQLLTRGPKGVPPKLGVLNL
jgi:hypothetical protein